MLTQLAVVAAELAVVAAEILRLAGQTLELAAQRSPSLTTDLAAAATLHARIVQTLKLAAQLVATSLTTSLVSRTRE